MTPGARLAAAIAILDRHLSGDALERALTRWARGARYAGSKDRAAVRDIVFQSLRCRDSYAYLGGALTGRGLAIGHVLCDGGSDLAPEADATLAGLFSGLGYGPAALTDAELEHVSQRVTAEALRAIPDLPLWLVDAFETSLGADYQNVVHLLKTRAPVFVRANMSKSSRSAVQRALAEEGIESRPHDLADTALEITTNARRISQSRAYRNGLVELQDAASQAVIRQIDATGLGRVLDYCAGGGGKTLALADKFPDSAVFAHDAAPARMVDLPERAARAGAEVSVLRTSEIADHAPFDLVLCDVPCSGSGAWRRAVEGKWLLTPESFSQNLQVQAEILDNVVKFIRPGGYLVYVTCSLLRSENSEQIREFMSRHDGFELISERQFSPLDGGDGFYCAILSSHGG